MLSRVSHLKIEKLSAKHFNTSIFNINYNLFSSIYFRKLSLLKLNKTK